jgi:hypothetical protein
LKEMREDEENGADRIIKGNYGERKPTEAYRFDVLALGRFSRHGGLHDGVKVGCPKCRVEVAIIFGRIRR